MNSNTAITATPTTGVRHEAVKSEITLDKIYKADFQKEGTMSAQIRQTLKNKAFYPSKKIGSNLQANIFALSDFGFTEQEFISDEVRIAWLLVPENATEADIKAKLLEAHSKGATIYKVLANKPILDENQKYAINQALRTMDDFANSQIVRYPKNDKTIADGTADKIILDLKGNPQYRRTFFWNTPMNDVDARDGKEVYMSPEIKLELTGASAMAGQSL